MEKATLKWRFVLLENPKEGVKKKQEEEKAYEKTAEKKNISVKLRSQSFVRKKKLEEENILSSLIKFQNLLFSNESKRFFMPVTKMRKA